MIVSAVYCPLEKRNCKMEYDDFLNYFENLGPHFICGGDFNSKHHHWGSRLISTRSRKLYQLIQDLKFDLLSTGKPTYWPPDPNKIPDLIDFLYTRIFLLIILMLFPIVTFVLTILLLLLLSAQPSLKKNQNLENW